MFPNIVILYYIINIFKDIKVESDMGTQNLSPFTPPLVKLSLSPSHDLPPHPHFYRGNTKIFNPITVNYRSSTPHPHFYRGKTAVTDKSTQCKQKLINKLLN